MNLIDFFDRGLSIGPNAPCLTEDDHTLTYSDVSLISHRLANALIAANMKGKKVAVYSPNMARVMVSILGALRAGAIWLPINARNALEENTYILNNLECDWLFYHSEFENEIAHLRSHVPSLKGAVCLDREGSGAAYFDQWIADFDGPAPDISPDPNGVPAILSSGGTTGKPKGVVTTNYSWELMICNYVSCMPFTEVPRQLVAAPLSHGAGAMCFPVFAGGGVNIIMSKPDPLSIMKYIERHKITRLYLPPTVIYMMLSHPKVGEFDYSSLKYFLYAAAPMSVDKLKTAIEIFGPVMCQSFGQAESNIFQTFLSPEDHVRAIADSKEHRLLSCGRPTLTNQIEVMDEDGRLLPVDEPGEIVIRSGMTQKEYYNNPQATKEAALHGWHHTGDIGCKDADGFVYIVDRKKDMIITGGFNVYPSEIEQLIMGMEQVQDCAVIGVPDEKWGEAVKAVIQTKPGRTLSEQQVIDLCRKKLGGVKTPKTVELWDDLPRSAVGKVLKKVIREKFWHDQDRRVG